MSQPDQSRPSDRNLLFGLLALQMDFISRDALIEGMQAWVLDKQKTLAELLVNRGALSASRRQLLEPLVDEHVRQHGGDPQQSLAAVSSVSQVAEKLQEIADSDLQQSLAHVAAPLSSEVGAFSQVQTMEQHPQASVSASAPQAHESDEFAAEFKLTLLQGSQELRPQAGRFLLLRPHAEGGLGKVWVAKDRELNREVAFKEIKASRAQDRNSRGRFILEAEITGGLEHPGIVPVYGLGHFDDGRPFYAMRFIRGHSLREAIQRFHRPVGAAGQRPVVSTVTGDLEHSLEFRKLLQRLIDVCNAIAYAHSRGVLHRDLKPDNIMLGKYGETLVVDWGLAKVKGESLDQSASEDVTDSIGPEPHLSASGSGSGEEITPTHGAVGTPLFMSPEQAAGRLNELGAATDIYSLGATLYELLTGQAPIGATADGQREKLSLPEVLRRAEAGEFPAPRSVLSAVPAALEAVCLKAMSLKPSARYASANDLAADLERWLAGDPVSAWREPRLVRAKRWARRHQTFLATSAAVLLVSVVSLGTLSVIVTGKNSVISKQQQITEGLLYVSQIRSSADAWDRGDVPEAWRQLSTAQWNLRGWEHDYLYHKFETSSLATLKGHSDYVNSVSFSADGKRIVSGSRDNTVKVWEAATGQETLTFKGHSGFVASVTFSPDGKRIVSGSADNTVKVWEAATGQETLTLKGHSGSVLSVSFSPDGKRIVSGSEDNTLTVWDAVTGQETLTLNGHSGSVNCVSFSPDDMRIVSGSADNTLKVWDAVTGQNTLTLNGISGAVCNVCFSPDGKRIASGSSDNTVKVWNAATGQETLTLKGHSDYVSSVSFSPDGERIVTGSNDTKVKVWNAVTGQEILSITELLGGVTSVNFSPDGKLVVSGSRDNSVTVWDAVTGQEILAITGFDSMSSVSFSPDGKRIVSQFTGSPQVWDVVTGKETLTLTDTSHRVTSVSFSPNGKQIWGCGIGTATVWDAATGREIRTIGLTGHKIFASNMSFSPDGKRIISSGFAETLRIWNAATGQETLDLRGHSGDVSCVSFSPDGKRIASGNRDGTIKLWDASTSQETLTVIGQRVVVAKVSFSADGKRIVACDEPKDRSQARRIVAWDVVTGLATDPQVGDVDLFRPDVPQRTTSGDRMVEADGIKLIIKRISTGEVLFTGYDDGEVLKPSFSPDGKKVVSGCSDGTVKVWLQAARSAPAEKK